MNGEIFLGNIRGQKGDTGSGLRILEFYDTVEALSSAVPNPSNGDAYGVGSEAPYDIYIYSAKKGWVNNGALAPDINEQTPNYAEATTLETLTSGEKISIAFGKIKKAITDFIAHKSDTTGHITSDERTAWNGKAPGGKGLGGSGTAVGGVPLKDVMHEGCGFFQVGSKDDSPLLTDGWLGMIQLVRNPNDDAENGAQLVFNDFEATPIMWLRTLIRGQETNWVEMLHSGNIADYRHKIVTGTYTGDSTAPRKISLDFTPDIVLVFGKSGMVSFLTQENGYRGCGGMAFKGFPCKVADIATIEIVDGGFNVAYVAPNGDATVHVPMTNESGAQYYYMAIRQPIL